MKRWLRTRGQLLPAVAVGMVVTGAAVASIVASDHQQTPFTELNPRFDITDVHAFPGSDPTRLAISVSTSSPLSPDQTRTHSFANIDEALYQIKIDNTGDTVEDLVFQVSFVGPAGAQVVTVRGPTAPNETGTTNTLLAGGTSVVTGPANTVIGSPTGLQVFAGARDDPFFIDLETFFRLIPDRKPVTGPLSELPSPFPTVNSFRPAGEAVDFLRTFNHLAIVVEVPMTTLNANGALPNLGIWATVNKAGL